MYKFLIAGALLITLSGCSMIASGYKHESRPYSPNDTVTFYGGQQHNTTKPTHVRPAPLTTTPENLQVPRPTPTAPNLQPQPVAENPSQPTPSAPTDEEDENHEEHKDSEDS